MKYSEESFSNTSTFWSSYPLFFLSTFLLFGLCFAMTQEWVFFAMGLFLTLALIRKKNTLFFFLSLLFLTLGFFLGVNRTHQLPKEKKLQGTGEFVIDAFFTVNAKKTIWIYQGKLKSFESNHITYTNIPCQFTFMGYKNRPKGNFTYLLEGKLIKKRENSYSFKLDKKKNPLPLHKEINLCELRCQAKEAAFTYLKKHIEHPSSCAFLTALITGKSTDSTLRSSFGKLGLQHIMAISGFHFSLFTFFFSLVLFSFPHRWKTLLLLLLVNSYFLFLGMTPSITRAYISIMISLFALVFGRRYSPLNALGAGLVFEMLSDPLSLWNLGLELSYLACGAIFIIYPLIEKKMRLFFPHHTPESLSSLSLLGKSMVKFSSFFRMSLSLSVAINLTLIPVLLYQFHLFPLMSLIYNLFIPLFVSGCLFLTLSVIGISLLLPFLAKPLFAIVTFMTTFCLDFVFTAPSCLQVYIRMKGFPFFLVILIVTLLFFFFAQKQFSSKNESPLSITL